MGKKGDNTKKRMIQGALHCFSEEGDRGTTFQKIADYCGVTQPLVVKYFETRENIFPMVITYIIERWQTRLTELFSDSGTPEEQLKQYIRAHDILFKESVEFSQGFIMFHYLASTNQKFRKLNEELRKVGVDRINEILNKGIGVGAFSVEDVATTASTIYNNLLGMYLGLIIDPSYDYEGSMAVFENMITAFIQNPKK